MFSAVKVQLCSKLNTYMATDGAFCSRYYFIRISAAFQKDYRYVTHRRVPLETGGGQCGCHYLIRCSIEKHKEENFRNGETLLYFSIHQ